MGNYGVAALVCVAALLSGCGGMQLTERLEPFEADKDLIKDKPAKVPEREDLKLQKPAGSDMQPEKRREEYRPPEEDESTDVAVPGSAERVYGAASGGATLAPIGYGVLSMRVPSEMWYAGIARPLPLSNPFRDEFLNGQFRDPVNSEIWKLNFRQLVHLELEAIVASDHRHKGNKDLYEKNHGIAGRYFFDERNFALAAFIDRNSQKEKTWLVGWGHREVVFQEQKFKLYAGGTLDVVHYGLKNGGYRVEQESDGETKSQYHPDSYDGPMGSFLAELEGPPGLSFAANYIPKGDVWLYSLRFQKFF